jgi:hypothetical protein
MRLDWFNSRRSIDGRSKKKALGPRLGIYGEHDPVPVAVTDLEDIVATRAQVPVPSRLNWSVLS